MARLDRTIQSYFHCDTPVEAWRKLIQPGQTIGLKVNCLSGKGASTRPARVEAVCERLQQAEVGQDKTRSGRIRYTANDVLGYESELTVFGNAVNYDIAQVRQGFRESP